MKLNSMIAFPKACPLLLSAMCTSFLAFAPLSATASETVVGASERVNFSGKLRMLSQRVAAAACNYSAGVAEKDSLAVLVSAQSEFNKIAHGLEFGDTELNMPGAEQRRKTVHAIHELHGEWDAMSSAIDGIVDSEESQANVEFVNQHNMDVLAKAKVLVSEIAGQYSNPFEMTQADALLVDYSGRQRMLIQKMSKESCQVWSGNTDAIDALSGTMQTFEATLMALRGGNSNAGIKASPTNDIYSGLSGVWNDWIDVKPVLNKAVANETVDETVRADIFSKMNTMLVEMNAVVGLYATFAKSGT